MVSAYRVPLLGSTWPVLDVVVPFDGVASFPRLPSPIEIDDFEFETVLLVVRILVHVPSDHDIGRAQVSMNVALVFKQDHNLHELLSNLFTNRRRIPGSNTPSPIFKRDPATAQLFHHIHRRPSFQSARPNELWCETMLGKESVHLGTIAAMRHLAEGMTSAVQVDVEDVLAQR